MKFIIDNIFLIALVLVSGGALLIPSLQRRGAKVSLLQATQLMNQNKSNVIDVRDIAEFEVGPIKSAKNIPLNDLSNRMTELEKQKANPVIVVCASGTRSATAVAMLTRAGFTQAVSMDGGMSAWQAQGLPVVK